MVYYCFCLFFVVLVNTFSQICLIWQPVPDSVWCVCCCSIWSNSLFQRVCGVPVAVLFDLTACSRECVVCLLLFCLIWQPVPESVWCACCCSVWSDSLFQRVCCDCCCSVWSDSLFQKVYCACCCSVWSDSLFQWECGVPVAVLFDPTVCSRGCVVCLLPDTSSCVFQQSRLPSQTTPTALASRPFSTCAAWTSEWSRRPMLRKCHPQVSPFVSC